MSTFWIVVGAVIVVGLGASMLYDHRVRRRGGQVRSAGQMTSETMHNHDDIEAATAAQNTEGGFAFNKTRWQNLGRRTAADERRR